MIAKSVRVYLNNNCRSVAVLPSLATMTGNIAAGTVVGQLIVVWITLAGSTSWSLGALCVGSILGLLAHRIAAPQPISAPDITSSTRSGWGPPTIITATSGILILFACLMPELLSVSLSMGSQAFANSPATLISTSFWSTCLALSVPTFMITLLTAAALIWNDVCQSFSRTERKSDVPQTLLLGSMGMCVLLIHSNFSLPLSVTVSMAVGVSMFIHVAAYLVGSRRSVSGMNTFNTTVSELEQSERRPLSTHAGQPKELADAERPRITAFVQAMIAGVTVRCIAEFAVVLMPAGLPMAFLTVLMTSLLIWTGTRRVLSTVVPPNVVSILAIVVLSCLPLVFSGLVDINLSLNSSVAWPWLLMLARSLQLSIFVAAAFLPLFLQTRNSAAVTLAGRNSAAVGTLMGALIAMIVSAAGAPPRGMLTVSILLMVFISLRMHVLPRTSANRFSFILPGRQLAGAAILLCGLLLLLTLPSVHSGRAVQLLFSSRSLTAYRMGIDPDLIPQSDSSRLVQSIRTAQGEIHVWRRSGHIFEFHRNGRSLGRISTDSNRTPQPVEDALPAILPLVVHPAPDRILILGDDTGICLRTCSHFPAQRIVAVRDDRRLTQLAREYTWQQQPALEQDPRISIIDGPSMVTVRAPSAVRFDVVIAAHAPAEMAYGSAEFNTEYYQHIRQQLTDDGVFCQRFRQFDLGPESLKQVLSTAMSSFQNVVAVQSAPGEIVLVAGNSDARFLNHHVLTRLQHDFIRREIAASGWDWVQVAILPMLDAADPVGVFGHQSPPAPMTISNSRFALSLPIEVHRWLDRPAELRAEFSQFQLRLAEAIPPDQSHQEIKRRLTLLTQQAEILAGMPDEPWTYRKSLRTEMQRNPRPPREVVRNNQIVREMHPVDQLLQNYFVTLGGSVQAVLSGDRSSTAFQQLKSFATLHEPLLSFFVHFELIRLHELAEHPAPEDEYLHRLHIVYFTEQSDASVRPVIAAMQQLIDHPDLLQNDAERFDQLNSMLQKLIERWEARTAWEPRSATRVQNDVDQSVLVSSRALEKLREWSSAVNLSDAEFLKRRRFIHSALTHPLKDYREEVLAHRLKHEKANPSNTSSDDDLPLLINPAELSTN